MHHFISYSSVDGQELAFKLAQGLERGTPPLDPWVDKIRLHPGPDWDEQLEQAIRVCESLIFVMTPDSVEHHSVCKNEWVQALRFKKPLVPLRMHPDAKLPFLINQRQCIDFLGGFEPGLDRLRQHLQWLRTPAGELEALHSRLADARRDHRRVADAERPRVEAEMQQLEADIERLRIVVENPAAAEAQTQRSIEARMESERKPSRLTAEERRARFINPPPTLAPPHFQDRTDETGLVAKFLQNGSFRLMILVGRGGVGKTALVCRLLKALEQEQLPDGLGSFEVEGIVYLSEVGSHRINVPNLHGDLCRLLPNEAAERHQELYKATHRSTRDKMLALLEEFQMKPVIVLLDNVENLVEAGTRHLTDSDLLEALRAVLEAPQHQVRILITTRVAPQDLALVQPQRQKTLTLGEGLESPFAEAVLRALDADGTVGLRDASDALLGQVRQRTRGFPRALEAFYGSLVADRSTSLEELLKQAEHTLPENVVETLVGEAFSRLDRTAQMVMQALAVYARPVPPVAVDFLLQPWVSVVDSAPLLNWLVNMHFVRKEKGRFFLHPVDQSYALSRVPEGARYDLGRMPLPWTQVTLRERAADYFAQTRLNRADWKTLADLEPQLAEIEVRSANQDHEVAVALLGEIDFNYLFQWGHARLLLGLRERLQPCLKDREAAATNSGYLGNVYCRLGDYAKSIVHYESAIATFRDLGQRGSEAVYLGNFGVVFWDQGRVSEAQKHWERALQLARETFQISPQSAFTSNLGLVAAALGQFDSALERFEQSLALGRRAGDKSGEAADLAFLGNVHLALGKEQKAAECHQRSLSLAQETGDRFIESLARAYAGMAHLCRKDATKALPEFEAATEIAREIQHAESLSEANMDMALARLNLGDFDAAHDAAKAAREARYGRHLPMVLFLLGVASLRKHDEVAARQSFQEATAQANALLDITKGFYSMHEASALASFGLALMGYPEYAGNARSAHSAARAITRATGVVARFRVFYEELSKMDDQRLLPSLLD